ncbi:MAG: uncharacterized protein A8A55_2014 [Amphiamblys sp. WSBS2006]|nr:MAG: uncharacterized protein A8A55_2014 [Amphiamblys sp. WSBS2006]
MLRCTVFCFVRGWFPAHLFCVLSALPESISLCSVLCGCLDVKKTFRCVSFHKSQTASIVSVLSGVYCEWGKQQVPFPALVLFCRRSSVGNVPPPKSEPEFLV